MSQSLITIGTYWDIVEAQLAKIHLEAVGIRSVLQNENSIQMDWLAFANASKGVQLQVASTDVDAAREVLEQSFPADSKEIGNEWETPEEETAEEHEESIPEDSHTHSLSDEMEDERLTPLNLREKRIKLAYRAARIGWFFSPIQFYATYLLGLVAISEEPIRPILRGMVWKAVVINGLFIGILFYVAWILNGH